MLLIVCCRISLLLYCDFVAFCPPLLQILLLHSCLHWVYCCVAPTTISPPPHLLHPVFVASVQSREDSWRCERVFTHHVRLLQAVRGRILGAASVEVRAWENFQLLALRAFEVWAWVPGHGRVILTTSWVEIGQASHTTDARPVTTMMIPEDVPVVMGCGGCGCDGALWIMLCR